MSTKQAIAALDVLAGLMATQAACTFVHLVQLRQDGRLKTRHVERVATLRMKIGGRAITPLTLASDVDQLHMRIALAAGYTPRRAPARRRVPA